MDVSTTTMSIPGHARGRHGGHGRDGAWACRPAWADRRSSCGSACVRRRGRRGTPEAQHEIPPGMNMGAALPLIGYTPTQGTRAVRRREADGEAQGAAAPVLGLRRCHPAGPAEDRRHGEDVADRVRQGDGRTLAARSRRRLAQCAAHVAQRTREAAGAARGEPARQPAREGQRHAGDPLRDRRQAGLHGAVRGEGGGADERAHAAVVDDGAQRAGLLPAGDGRAAERRRDDHLDVERAAGHGLGPDELPAQRFRAPDDHREGGAAGECHELHDSRRASSRAWKARWSTASRTARS